MGVENQALTPIASKAIKKSVLRDAFFMPVEKSFEAM
jgi:hypothetical protein